jgi:AraC-like DNA-binding protein
LFSTPIGDYKLQLRMHEAKRLLMKGKSIKATSFELHYAGPSAFTNAFRNYFGLTPSEWLKTINNGHGE